MPYYIGCLKGTLIRELPMLSMSRTISLGFRVQGFRGSGVYGLGFRVQGLGFRGLGV